MMRRESLHPNILPQSKDWPIVQLNAHLEEFVKEVIHNALQAILDSCQGDEALREVLWCTVQQEKLRLKQRPWRIDPPDELNFWSQVATDLTTPQNAPRVLENIITRYVHEIVGHFTAKHFWCAEKKVTYALSQLLCPVSLKGTLGLVDTYQRLQERIHITGEVSQLRKLAQIGTIVMVPTHFSHLDSLVIGWVIYMLGLPPFLYGAGMNLFNSIFFARFVNNLGVYKVDRRKKNLPYLTTLKAYSCAALQRGCHSLFYPGGTRSRSGALEPRLKLGLLGTAIEAQRRRYHTQGSKAPKIFVVPVVFNCSFVLEASFLIESYLANQGIIPGMHPLKGHPPWYKQLQLGMNVWKREGAIHVSVGNAMDLLGNVVDTSGVSYDAQGASVDTYEYFHREEASVDSISSKDEVCTKKLGEAILGAYYRCSYILASQLVAFAAFELMRKAYYSLSLAEFLRRSPIETVLPYTTLSEGFAKLRAAVLQLHKASKVHIGKCLRQGSTATMIQHGLNNLGVYHIRRPLARNSAGDIVSQDLSTLFYYHNRITGYGLEAYI
ncbi:MAG: 1-acyl-sn-glycerol-3-phosphate acyltransferase [Bacteroidota bacterium]